VAHLSKTRNESDANHEDFVRKIQNIYGTFSTASELVENIQVYRFMWNGIVRHIGSVVNLSCLNANFSI
jgi:hypothetical protein